MMSRSGRADGFTLVEVLVASAIAIASLGILMSLFAGSLDRMARVEVSSQQLIAEKEVVNRLSLINPAIRPSGKGQIGPWRYEWQSQPITEFRQVTDYFPTDPVSRKVAVFLISVKLELPENKSVSLEINKLGWRS